MPKPRTLTISVSTPDDGSKLQPLRVDLTFDPPLDKTERSFLASFAEALIRSFPVVRGAKPRILHDTEASLN